MPQDAYPDDPQSGGEVQAVRCRRSEPGGARRAFANKGEFARALKDFDKAIEIQPAPWSYINRGWILMEPGELYDPDRAIADFTRAIELKPDDTGAHYLRGIALDRKGSLDRAITDTTEALRLDPDGKLMPQSPSLMTARAYYIRGRAHAARGETDSAVIEYAKAIKLDPESVPALEGRANVYDKLGRHDLADGDRAAARRLPAAAPPQRGAEVGPAARPDPQAAPPR